MPRFMQYALVAAQEALDDAGWYPEDPKDQEMTVSPFPPLVNCIRKLLTLP